MKEKKRKKIKKRDDTSLIELIILQTMIMKIKRQ